MWPVFVRWLVAGAAAYVGMELAKSVSEGLEYSWKGRTPEKDKTEDKPAYPTEGRPRGSRD